MSKSFKVKALYKRTNRIRTVTIQADTEKQLLCTLIDRGYLEPFEISEVEAELPTDKQIEYAQKLGIELPNEITKADISSLIENKLNNDSEPNPELIEYAKGMGLLFPKYIGKKSLYNFTYNQLSYRDKLAFFVFAIYRHLSDDRRGNLLLHPYKEKIYEFVDTKVIDDKQFTDSAFRYNGQDLRYFGTIRFSNGEESTGGSINTISYKTAADFISSSFKTPKTRILKVQSKQNHKSTGNSKKSKYGCAPVLALAVLLILVIIVVKYIP